jgi:hypothetical protein
MELVEEPAMPISRPFAIARASIEIAPESAKRAGKSFSIAGDEKLQSATA